MKFPRSWKTTLMGATLILSAIAGAANNKDGWVAALADTKVQTEFFAGLGLLAAKDSNVSGPRPVEP